MPSLRPCLSPHNLNQMASGKLGAVQCVILTGKQAALALLEFASATRLCNSNSHQFASGMTILSTKACGTEILCRAAARHRLGVTVPQTMPVSNEG